MEKSSKPKPQCYIYDMRIGKWQPFKTLIIKLFEQDEIFFTYENPGASCFNTIYKRISYEYIAYYSKLIPSAVRNSTFSVENSLTQSEVSSAPLQNLDIKSIIVLEDLDRHYDSICQEDQYILLGFDVKNLLYEENNLELKFIRDIIAELHVKLKYSEGGLVYQMTQRFRRILYKTLKYSLCYISSLCNIAPGFSVEEKLRHLQKMYYDPAFQEYLDIILKDPEFVKEIYSITYKTFISVGLLPMYVELNTMNEVGIVLKIKNLLTNLVNAPYGSSHHASFSIGNFRYSFVFEPGNKEKQRVNIGLETGRGFNYKNHRYEYFRVKFFDFFPMDTWVQGIANRALRLIKSYFVHIIDLIPEFLETETLKDYLLGMVHEQEEQHYKNSITSTIASEFYDRYRSELDETRNDKLFKKVARLISDAEVRGYSNLSNNCQTIVSEIISVFGTRLQRFVEPLFDLSKIPYMDDVSKEELLRDFLKFGSHFNSKFSNIAPFPLTYRLSYFDTFSDKDSCELFYPKNFDNMHKHMKEFMERESTKRFLAKLEEDLTLHTKIHIRGFHGQQSEQGAVKLPNINFGNGNDFTKVSCLLSVIYNELFNVKREIKMSKHCEELLAEATSPNEDEEMRRSKKASKKSMKKWEKMTDKMPLLYEKKHKLMEIYQELCFYYYNTVRLGLKIKLSDKVSVLGFLITKKPNVIRVKEKEDFRSSSITTAATVDLKSTIPLSSDPKNFEERKENNI